ncbi:MAG: HAD family hydrolase [Gammaproteobacteria bacterium]|nr:MAG: HAD family hydrolase [Gammaproteobacteria bacterium]
MRLIVFDWDGTLIDSRDLIVACMQAAIREVDLPPRTDAQVADIIGLGLREAVETLYPEVSAERRAAMIDRYRRHWLARQHECRLFPGARETLERLHQAGFLLAVATGKSRAGLERSLQETGLARLFSSTRCADETASKPDPRMLHEILGELDVPASAAILVGDTEYDLEMARRAGVAALGVCYGVHEATRLSRHRPLAILDRITRLPDWLAEYRARGRRAVTVTQGMSG